MKFLKRLFLTGCGVILLCSMVIWTQLSALPASMTILKGKPHALPAFVAPEATRAGFLLHKNGKNVSITPTETGNYSLDFSTWGIFKKTVNVNVVQAEAVIPGGDLLGIKMYMDGVLVIGLSEIPGTGKAPGKEAGIKAGDRIISVNGNVLSDSTMLEEAVEKSDGAALLLERDRNGTRETVQLSPVYYEEGEAYKIGLWVRDSTAGVGTLTFVKPEDGSYGALGHAIADFDTGETVSVAGGAVTDCRISHIEKGEKGAPGAVQGRFDAEIGSLTKNTETGIFGAFFDVPDRTTVQIALANEVQKGACAIYSGVLGNGIHAYSAEIEKVFMRGDEKTKSMCIRITDPVLLKSTGGIIQGMSGSPILQNGRIVGAVTHVFVNDPTRGYGIFIENMLAETETLSD